MFSRPLVIALCCTAMLFAQQTMREKAVSIPVGEIVDVRLNPKGKERVKGQLVSVSEQGLSVRTVDGGAVKERVIPFDEIQSLSQKRRDSHTGLKILAGIGIALASLWVIAALALGS